MKPYKFILSGGGTGGHIYPAIAIANELKSRFPDAEFLFVGAEDKMEMQKVPQSGYKIIGLWIAGIQRRITFDNALFPIKLLSSLLKARKIIREFKPDVVIGTGGFASGPLLQIAGFAGIPTVIQEQNSYPGITNKLLSKKASKICVAYENLERFFPKEKMILTGNPVRQDVLLALGVQIFWQCGNFYMAEYKIFSEREDVQVVSFIDRMDLIYAAADFVISRAGASSVSELCLVGKPTIFIPSPNVAEDHQTKNGKAIVDKKGALLIKESELEEKFESVFNKLLYDENLQRNLSLNMKKLAKPNATKDIVEEIIKLIK